MAEELQRFVPPKRRKPTQAQDPVWVKIVYKSGREREFPCQYKRMDGALWQFVANGDNGMISTTYVNTAEIASVTVSEPLAALLQQVQQQPPAVMVPPPLGPQQQSAPMPPPSTFQPSPLEARRTLRATTVAGIPFSEVEGEGVVQAGFMS
jgi:hypothetical protein